MTLTEYQDICTKYSVHFYCKPSDEELQKIKVEDFEEQVKKLVNILSKRGEKNENNSTKDFCNASL